MNRYLIVLISLCLLTVVSAISPANLLAANGSIIIESVDIHFEVVDASLPTVTNVQQLTFFGDEYRNTSDVDGSGAISGGDTDQVDGVFAITSFISNGFIVVPPGFGSTWEITGTYLGLQDVVLPLSVPGTINYIATPNIGVVTLYVGTDMTQPATALTGLGYDDGTMVAQFLVISGGGVYRTIAPFDGARDMNLLKQSSLAGLFVPDIQAAVFDSNLDADSNNNGIGGDFPIPSSWQYPVATPEVNFPWSYYAFVDGSMRFGNISECCIDIEKQVSVVPFPDPDWRDADMCSDSDVPIVPVPHNAMYQLIVKNCGDDTLTNVTVTDPTLGINTVIADLAPNEERTLTGVNIAELGFNANQCTSAGSIENTAAVEADCSDPAQSPVTDEDSACWKCETCVVDIEKQVREIKDPLDDWADADQCTDADVPSINVPGGAMYRLIVENTGGSILTNCTITDDQLGIVYDLTADLGPGDSVTFTGQNIPELFIPDRCQAAGELLNTAAITCDCADVPDEKAMDSDDACVECLEQTGQCRLTHGSVTVNQDGTYDLYGGPAELDMPPMTVTTTTGKGKKATTSTTDVEPWFTWGGQLGAPTANDPSRGEITHSQHQHPLYGSFTFHAGTSSASEGTEISSIECSDPQWCANARCAPFKQLFSDGIGEFENLHENTGWDAACDVTPKSGKGNGNKVVPGSLHYFRVHFGDFGEPGGNFLDPPNLGEGPQPSENTCDWVSGGLDIADTVLMHGLNGEVPPVAADGQAGEKGGQACAHCPDYYEIEIHCTKEPSSPVIYEVHDFIDRGNIQIHPEVGSACHDFY